MPTEPFRLKLDTEQLSALAVYKVILIQTIEKKEVYRCVCLEDPVIISSDFCTRQLFTP